jgi:putative ABC transport system permease protein
MLKNYFLVAFRSLRKNKSYLVINAFGVGIALACCLAAYLTIAYDFEFDDFHADKKVEHIFKIHMHLREKDGTVIQNNSAPMALSPIAVPEIAGIERFTRYLHEGAYMRYGDKAFSEKVSFADSTFFDFAENS